jgi:hypothetical protein
MPKTLDIDAIPVDLRMLDQWVCWRFATRNGKATKVPYQALSPRAEASTTNPSTWASFGQAASVFLDDIGLDGIGFVFAPGDGLAGIDLDRCIRDDGTLESWAENALGLLNGYAEVSPSGRGMKVFVRAECPGGQGRKRLGLSPEGTGAIECYDRGRYFTVTGNVWSESHSDLASDCPNFADFHSLVFPPKPDRVRVDPAPSSMEDAELIRRAHSARNGFKFAALWEGRWQAYFGTASEADLSLCSLLAFWTQDEASIDRLFRQSGMVDSKWTERADYRALTIGKALERTTIHSQGFAEKNVTIFTNNTINSPLTPGSDQEGGNISYSKYLKYSSTDNTARGEGAGDGGEEWPPCRLEGPEAARPFPLEALPAPLAELVSVAANCLGCPIDFPALAALGVASGAMGRRLALKVKDGWVEAPAIYAALVGDPGTTKSPAVGLMAAPLWKITHEQLEMHRRDLEQARRAKDEDAGPVAPKRVVVDDATTEAMAALLMENPRGLVMVRDELSALLSGMNQYKAGGKGSDRQFYLSAWSGSSVSVDRKHSVDRMPLHIPHPFLSIVGGMTPGMLSEMGEGKGRDDGFLDRFLFTCPEPVPVRWSDEGVPPDLAQAWEWAIRRLWLPGMTLGVDNKPRPWFVRFTPDATACYAAWYDAHNEEAESDDFPAYLRGPWAKMRAYCARLALALDRLALAFDPEHDGEPSDVGVESLSRAIILVDYFKAHTRRVRAMMRGSFGECPDARKVLRWVRSTGRDRFLASEVRNNFRKLFPADGPELDIALRWLEGRHCIRQVPTLAKSGPGRPRSPEYEINPELLGDMAGGG